MKIMFVLGGGGHTTDLVELTKKIDGKFEYVVDSGDKLSIHKVVKKGRGFRTFSLRRIQDDSFLKVLIRVIPSFVSALHILSKSKSKVIISTGPGIFIPFAFLGKVFFGKRIVYVENIARVYSKSWSGKLVYPFSDLFFVQWPELKKKYKRAIYAGRLM